MNVLRILVLILFSSHCLPLQQLLMILGCRNESGDLQRFVTSLFWVWRSWWRPLSLSHLFDMCSISDDQLCNCRTCEWPIHVSAPCRSVEHSTKRWRWYLLVARMHTCHLSRQHRELYQSQLAHHNWLVVWKKKNHILGIIIPID